MKTFFNKSKITAALLTGSALMAAGVAHAAPIDFTFNTANIAGSTTAYRFVADEITMTSVDRSTFTFTDTSAPFGIIGAADSFVELGIISSVNFQSNNVNLPVRTSGINFDYELLASFAIRGVASLVGGNIVVNFLPSTGSVATIYYDENVNSVIDGATIIGQLTAGAGDCVITAGTAYTQGSCKIDFAFDTAAVSDAGVWTYLGGDLGAMQSIMTIDINGNRITTSSPLPLYPVSGIITGALDHSGSAEFSVVNVVPEPGTIAIMGLGLLGLAGFARRRGRTSN